MGWLTLVTKLLPSIFQLVMVAEKLITKKGAGAEKKAAVKAGVGAIMGGLTAVSTGGQADTVKKVQPLVTTVIDPVIDFAADMLFGDSDDESIIVEQELED